MVDSASIDTEVFFLPAAVSFEKEGSITNSGRWAQWRYQAVKPLGNSLHDSAMINELYFRVAELYKKEGGAFPDAITKLSWDYGFKDIKGKVHHLDIHSVAKEINGYFLEDKVVKGKQFKKGDLVPSFAYLQDDGSTNSGNWLYCQSYNGKGNNMARRGQKDPSGIGLYPEWSWCWPINRRILYNRASVDHEGRPWNPKKWVIRWNPALKDGKGGSFPAPEVRVVGFLNTLRYGWQPLPLQAYPEGIPSVPVSRGLPMT